MIEQGDCLDLMKKVPDESVDAIVTDPPYGLSFLTVEECKRIQTFPDDFKFIGSDEKKIRMIGNAVPPNLAYSLAISIKNQMKNIYYGWEMDTSYYEVDE